MRFVALFVHRHLAFRLPELDSLLLMCGVEPASAYDKAVVDMSSVLLEIELPSAAIAVQVSKRGILLRGIFELIGKGSGLEEVLKSTATISEERKDLIANAPTWSMCVEAFGRKYTRAEQEELRGHFFRLLDFKGTVQLGDPAVSLWVCAEYGLSLGMSRALVEQDCKAIYFMREVGLSSRNSLVGLHALKHRPFLGPTSTDAELSLLMANQVCIYCCQPRTLIFF
jgi:tRNA (guanine10-N2)-methyltransferase